MAIFADAQTTAVAAFTSGAFLVIGQLVVWLINRGTTRNAERRNENADERAEESADIERYRNLANDALVREKLAYDRAVRAEDKLALAYTENERLRAVEQNLTGRVGSLETQLAKAKGDAQHAKEDLDQCRRHIRLIEGELKRRGIDFNTAYDD